MDVRERSVHTLLGQRVHVQIDRPVGYRHGDIVYPINYGYIPGVLAGDGEEQDVYILGTAAPLSAFDGRVIAVVQRHDDCEDKLVAAPDGMVFHQGEIAEAVHFQEQYFENTIVSLFQKSCGVIPYRQNKGQKEFLILLQNSGSWSFPKGHMEAFEAEAETALRELAEETGLQAILCSDIRITLEYDIPPLTRKQVILFPGEVQGEPFLQEKEIQSCRWVSFSALEDYLHADTLSACAQLADII